MKVNSFLRRWLAAHNMTEQEGRKKAGCTDALWQVLLGGGWTMPVLALEIGARLHMTQDEVRNIGPDEAFHAFPHAMACNNYEKEKKLRANFEPEWWTLLGEGRVHWSGLKPLWEYMTQSERAQYKGRAVLK